MNKKLVLTIAILIMCTGLLFAEFDYELGFYGGFGNAGAAGIDMQIGYVSPAYSNRRFDQPNRFRWSILADTGFGFRYGSDEMRKQFVIDTYYTKSGEAINTTIGYEPIILDYFLGLLAEFYFLRFMGLGIGGGVTTGLGDAWFTPYFRIELPILLNYFKFGLGFDYIFWSNDKLPKGIDPPPGYRVYLLINFRDELALLLLRAMTP